MSSFFSFYRRRLRHSFTCYNIYITLTTCMVRPVSQTLIKLQYSSDLIIFICHLKTSFL